MADGQRGSSSSSGKNGYQCACCPGLCASQSTRSSPSPLTVEPCHQDPPEMRTSPTTGHHTSLRHPHNQDTIYLAPGVSRLEIRTLSGPRKSRLEIRTLSGPRKSRLETRTLSGPRKSRLETRTLSGPRKSRLEIRLGHYLAPGSPD